MNPGHAIPLLLCCCSASAAVTVLGPAPYRQAADSPLYPGIQAGTIRLENFEDQAFNTPGVSVPGGQIVNDQGVDADDGSLDGFGRNYVYDWRGQVVPEYGPPWTFEINFTPDPEKGYPLYAGLALLGFSELPANLPSFYHFRAFDAAGVDLTGDIKVPGIHLPPSTDYYSSAGDQFIGIYSSSGISRILLGAGRFDHLQFGWAVPEPGIFTLSGLAAVLLLARRRRIGHLG